CSKGLPECLCRGSRAARARRSTPRSAVWRRKRKGLPKPRSTQTSTCPERLHFSLGHTSGSNFMQNARSQQARGLDASSAASRCRGVPDAVDDLADDRNDEIGIVESKPTTARPRDHVAAV